MNTKIPAIIRKRGTLVIPVELRQRYGILDGSPVLIEDTGGGFHITFVPGPGGTANDEYWAEVDQDFSELQKDPEAWAEYKAEFDEIDAAFAELPGEPPYSLD